MKRGLILVCIAIVLLTIFATSSMSAKSTGDTFNVTFQTMEQASEYTADCENQESQQDYIACRLQAPAILYSPHLNCRASLYPLWCEDLYHAADDCWQLTDTALDRCLLDASFSQDRYIPQPRAYVLLLANNFQLQAEQAYFDNQSIPLKQTVEIIDKFTQFAHSVIREEPVDVLSNLLAEAENSWDDAFDSR